MIKAVTYDNSETGFCSLRIVMGVGRLIYITDTDLEEGHRQHFIEHTIFCKLYLRVPIDLLDLEVKPYLYSCVLPISSVSNSTMIHLYCSLELYVYLQFYTTDKPHHTVYLALLSAFVEASR
jgi:hypothetical protein